MDRATAQRLTEIVKLLEQVRGWDQLSTDPGGQGWRVDIGSDFAADDVAAAHVQVSHRAWMAIVVALDHLRSLRESVIRFQAPGQATARLGMNAQFSVARGVLENAATATWLMQPAARDQRVLRRMRLEWGEINLLEETWDQAATISPTAVPTTMTPTADERRDSLRDLVRAAGGDPAHLKSAGFRTIVKDAADEAGHLGAHHLLVWRMCSGLAHGDMNAAMMFLNRKPIGSAGPGQVLHSMTGDVENLYIATGAGVLQLNTALTLYDRRARGPLGRAPGGSFA